MVMEAFLSATLLLLVSGLPGVLLPRSHTAGERFGVALTIAGAVLGSFAAFAALFATAPHFSLSWPVPGGALLLRLDAVSAVFLFPIYLVAALGAVYGLGYWSRREHPGSAVRLRLFYGLLAAMLTLVVTATNSLLFLFCWEIMALAGFFLVVVEDRSPEVRQAGYVYLTATHAGTLALFALFALLGESTGSFAFPESGTLRMPSAEAAILFLLGLFGFGMKAGVMPLHIWLPGAHAAAPSHVSAILSGVVIKTGIYGMVRLTSFFADIPPWWGWTVLVLGAVSGVIGVAFAIAQHDLKRLLAYHSVENIGIICLGLGVAMLGRSYGLASLVTLGMAGALLHVINHGLFKSLLFLGSGAVLHGAGTREIDRLGGLLQRMPWTGAFFLGGAVAISGLPPLNGFVSEWFIYLGLFASMEGEVLPARFAVLAAPALALIGGLALACFVKVFGAVFLGVGRTPETEGVHEAPASMLAPMGILLLLCVVIGLLPAGAIPLLEGATAAWVGAAGMPGGTLAAPLPAWGVTAAALGLLLLTAAAVLLLRRSRPAAAPRAATWGCGFARPTERMQYTASSFGASLVGLFRWSLRPERHGGRGPGLFAAQGEFATHTPDTVFDRLLMPLLRGAAWAGTWLRARIQCGSTSLYLFYVALTLGVLLALANLRGG